MKLAVPSFTLFLALSAAGHAADIASTLKVQAKSAIIIEAASGRVLWSKNADVQRPPASTTKILTSLLLLENRKLTDTITSPSDADATGGSSLHMKKGETISVEDALYAMLLRSANDVCHAVAVNMAGSDEAFAEMMNAKAKEIGVKNTHFSNPHGLPNPKHLTTARDLAQIARVAMENEEFRKVVNTRKRTINRSINQADRLLISRNKWLFKDATADGIKTGFTDEAGHCYVGSVNRNGFRVITVLLNSPDTQVDHSAMVQWVYKNYQVERKVARGNFVTEVPVINGAKPTLKVASAETLPLLNRRDTQQPLRFDAEPIPVVKTTILPGQPVGTIRVVDADGKAFPLAVVASEPLAPKPKPLISELHLPNRPGWWLAGGAMLCSAWVFKRKVRRY